MLATIPNSRIMRVYGLTEGWMDLRPRTLNNEIRYRVADSYTCSEWSARAPHVKWLRKRRRSVLSLGEVEVISKRLLHLLAEGRVG
jgi:hypothetical protein